MRDEGPVETVTAAQRDGERNAAYGLCDGVRGWGWGLGWKSVKTVHGTFRLFRRKIEIGKKKYQIAVHGVIVLNGEKKSHHRYYIMRKE